MSREDFAVVLGTLAVATNKELDAETVEVYFAGLCDVPLETLQAGVRRVLNGARFFPSVGEIRASCDRVKAQGGFQPFTPPKQIAGTLRDDDPRLWYACPICHDEGWAPHWCVGSVNAQPRFPDSWQSIGTCGSYACAKFGAKGYGHHYVQRCKCVPTNERIRERLEARRQYAGEPS
jgi:hypothetical protein